MTSQFTPSQMQSLRFMEYHECVCSYSGLLADHLRERPSCVENLRRQPQLDMVAPDNEAFIVKATVILRGCPAPTCPGGGHLEFPESCLLWWREIGWIIMGWKGPSENAETAAIKKKASMFRRNFLRRQPNRDQHSQQAENASTNLDSQRAEEDCCQICQHQGKLVHHLHQTIRCLKAYIQQYLPTRGHMYLGKNDLAVFDLGLLTQFCSNPACSGCLQEDGITRHLQDGCLKYYQDAGEKLFHWDGRISAEQLAKKLIWRKSYLKCYATGTYEESLAETLKIVCFRCNLRGPLMSANEHKMFVMHISHPPGGVHWLCFKCQKDDEGHSEMVLNIVEKITAMGTPGLHDDTMKKILVGNQNKNSQRVVLVPASIAADLEAANISDAELNPRNTTVLVPKDPEAMDQIGDEATERANLAKSSLESVAEFLGRRFFFGPVTECVSVLYRLKLAQIRLERLSMLRSLSSTSKGKIVSRDRRSAAVKDRNPHFAMTQQFCLTNTCNWTPGAQEKRSQESAARACVNGPVKIKIDMTVLKKVATDSPHLRDILSETLRISNPSSLLSLAPLVLNYVKAKVDLLVKHAISQSYQNWDLDLRFSGQEWTVKLIGFLYCKEFEDLNGKISCGEISRDEGNRRACAYQHLLPTTTTSTERLIELYSVSEQQAQVKSFFSSLHKSLKQFYFQEIVTLAEQHQNAGQSEPISLLTMYTPRKLNVSAAELTLRGRAVQLGETISKETDAVKAITEMIKVLKDEGLDVIEFHQDDLKRISDDLLQVMSLEQPNHKDLVRYHTLLWKAAGNGSWTMQRDPSESRMIPYIPALLRLSKMTMSAHITSSSDDHLLPGECLISEELKEVIKDQQTTENWQEISILEFVNSTLPSGRVPQATGQTNQTITQVITSKDRSWTWRAARDSDQETGETIFESAGTKHYVRTDGDVRKLYEGRPERVLRMPLGQLACEYRLLKPSDSGFEGTKNSIEEDSNVGPDSSDLVAGTYNVLAPMAMKLDNGKILKKRTEDKSVPLLLYSGKMSRHGSQLMWTPWQKLEDVTGQQDEMETAEQRRTRLQVFPLSDFPCSDDESDENDS